MDYEQAVEDFYTSILRPGDIAVDCGAHIGRHTLPMRKLVGATGHIYGFEPLPLPFVALQNSLSGVPNVTLENCALGDRSGKSTFVHVPAFPEYSGFRERIYDSETSNLHREEIEVTVKRLDEIVPNERVRYIKVDAEGGDLIILRGAEGILRKSRPFVTFELGDNSIVNYDYTSADYFDFFEKLGYRVRSILGNELNRESFVESSRLQHVWDYSAAPA